MQVIEKKARSGPDGVLRVEAPVGTPDADCTVVMYVYPEGEAVDDPWKALRRKLVEKGAQQGVKVPQRRMKYRPVKANDLPGPSASEILIRDRR